MTSIEYTLKNNTAIMKSFLLFILFIFSVSFVNSQIINFSDSNLKSYLLFSDSTNQIALDLDGNNIKIDANNDGEIQNTEANQVYEIAIDPGFYSLNNFITSFSGLESFSNLTTLSIVNIIGGTTITVENLLNLESLNVYYMNSPELEFTNLVSLNELNLANVEDSLVFFNNCENLETLNLVETLITDIDLSNLVNLKEFYTYGSELESLDFTNNINLENLNLNGTPGVTELDLSQNTNLIDIYFTNSGIIDVDLSSLGNLQSFGTSNTHVPIVDLSQSPNIDDISIIDFSNVSFLNIKNGTLANNINMFLANINYLCADDNEVNTINLTNANVQSINSYCSFTPGGEYYIVEGENIVDADLDGCDTGDYLYPNLKFNITSSSNDWTYYANASGNYSVPLSEGVHTLVPELENSNYFTVSPSSISVDFPSDSNPFIQDFCIIPNGVYNDLEVLIIPTGIAVPGFDSSYKISYRNNGNSLLSGAIEFDYSLNADVVQFLSANPTNDTEINNVLSWNYTELAPFETREINISFTLNTPTDPMFPLNDGDELGFIANISPLNDDETPSDNTFELKQTVVNSFDPNDIRCLEGESILPDDVGKYVHYLIRFENLGTANAINIVVNNAIDVTKFDINTLVPLSGSHDYYTRINADNDVEFIFENIQLPFDDANNDGYVVYKIKTLQNLVLGDEFSNQAEIYFDFNAPVITNNYITEVAEDTFSVDDFDRSDIKLYPNPVRDVLTIKTNVVIQNISVYDIEGREVLQAVQNDMNQIDMSVLDTGIYFLKLVSNSKIKTLKVIKH